MNILGQPLNNKCADISEFEGKQIAVEICKFAKSNLVQVNIKLAYFAGVALNSIGVLDGYGFIPNTQKISQYLGFPELKKYMTHIKMKSCALEAKVEVMQLVNKWTMFKVVNSKLSTRKP